MTKNLVLVRAGDRSTHPAWLASGERDFDFFVSYFGDTEGRYKDDGEYYEMRKGPKWPVIADIFKQQPQLLERYDTFWLPDDDVATTTETINRMFGLFKGLGLSLAQPALTRDSYHSWPLTLEHTNYIVRYTKFVEVMAPVFDRPALISCLPTFSESPSGYGLDYAWPKLVGRGRKHNIAILDATPMRHVRPLGGELYRNNPSLSPYEDEERIKEKYGAGNVRDIHAMFFFRGLRKVRPSLSDLAASAMERTWTTMYELRHRMKQRSNGGNGSHLKA